LSSRASSRDASAPCLTSKTATPRRAVSGRPRSFPSPADASAALPRARYGTGGVNKKTCCLPALSPFAPIARRVRRADAARDADLRPPPTSNPPSITQDLDIELSKPTRRALLPASAADNSSDRSEDTGIEATDALPAEDARQAVLRKAVPRKPVPELDLQTTPSGSDEESPALTPKAAKAAAKAAKKADKAPSKTANGTEEVAVRQRPTNNQLLYVLQDARPRFPPRLMLPTGPTNTRVGFGSVHRDVPRIPTSRDVITPPLLLSWGSNDKH